MTEQYDEASDLLTHTRYLESLARTLVGDDAADVVQETWLTAIEHPPRDRSNMRSWLRTVARHVVYKNFRKRRFDQHVDPSVLEQARDPARSGADLGVLDVIRCEALALEDPYGEVIRMRFFDRMSPAEIARELGRSTNTVNSQLQRGLRRLRQRLDRAHHGDRAGWTSAVLLIVGGDRHEASGPGAGAGAQSARSLSPLLVASALTVLACVATFALIAATRGPGSGPGDSLIGGEEVAAAGEAGLTPRPAVSVERVEIESPAPASAERPPSADAAPAPAPVVDALGWVDARVTGPDGLPLGGAAVSLRVRYGVRRTGPPFEDVGQTGPDGRLSIPLALKNKIVTTPSPDPLFYVGVEVRYAGLAESGVHLAPFPTGERLALEVRLVGPSAPVHGWVRGVNDQPVVDARVLIGSPDYHPVSSGGATLWQQTRAVATREDGTYENPFASPDTRVIHVYKPGFLTQRIPLSPANGEEREHNITLYRGGKVTGRVTTEAGEPYPGATVRVETGWWGVDYDVVHGVADSEGRYEVQAVPAGAGWITAIDPENQELSVVERRRFGPDEVIEWSPVLKRGRGLDVHVELAGEPMAGARVIMQSRHNEAPWLRQVMGNEDGVARFFACPDVEMSVSVFSTDKEISAGTVSLLQHKWVRPGAEPLRLAVTSQERGRMAGRASAADGRPPARADVYLSDGLMKLYQPVDPITGQYSHEHLAHGTYDVTVFCADTGIAIQEDIQIVAGETAARDVDLALPVPVSVDWLWPADPVRYAFALKARDPRTGRTPDTPRDYPVRSGLAPAPPVLQLYEGDFVLEVLRDGNVIAATEFSVREGARNHVSVGP